MSWFPKIDRPCPLRWAQMPGDGRDFCAQCQRRVHNLDAMPAPQRQAFLANCRGEVCVAYSVRRRRGSAAGLGLAAALSLSPAIAALSPFALPPSPTPPSSPLNGSEQPTPVEEIEIFVGGVRDPAATEPERLDGDPPDLPRVDADAFLDEAEFIAAPATAAPD